MKQKWREYGSDDYPTTWTRNALFALVSDRAGECEDIPPAEWDTPLAVSKVSQVKSCQNKEPYERFPGGITGGEESVADHIASWFHDEFNVGTTFLFGDEVLWCNDTLTDHSIAVESACWPNEDPISGDKYKNLRLTMKVPLRCEKKSVVFEFLLPTARTVNGIDIIFSEEVPLPMEFTNATIVMDVPEIACTGYCGACLTWSARIVDPPPP